MNRNLRYLVGAAVSIPLLPIIYFQGKKIKKNIPDLPEAKNLAGTYESTDRQPLKILSIGESTIAGVGVDTHDEGFTGLLAERLGQLLNCSIIWKVYAKSGYTASKVRANILPRITEEKVDLLVIGLGGNDAFTLNRPWRWSSQLKKLIKDLRERFPSAPIAFTNMPPIKEFPAFTKLIKFIVGNLVEIHGEFLKKVVRKHENVYYNPEILKVNNWLHKFDEKLERSDFFSDGVHPSKLSYQAWGKDFAEFLVREKVIS